MGSSVWSDGLYFKIAFIKSFGRALAALLPGLDSRQYCRIKTTGCCCEVWLHGICTYLWKASVWLLFAVVEHPDDDLHLAMRGLCKDFLGAVSTQMQSKTCALRDGCGMPDWCLSERVVRAFH